MAYLKVMIGRSSQCDYTIENPDQHGTVSGQHATISETDTPNTYLFEDHSTNGSYINGQFVHNGSCKVNATDHITLGKTYVLPIADIVKRYFMSKRTTDKKQPKQEDAKKPEETTNLQSTAEKNPTPVQPKVQIVEKVVEKTPIWVWPLYVVSVVIAFIIGLSIALI